MTPTSSSQGAVAIVMAGSIRMTIRRTNGHAMHVSRHPVIPAPLRFDRGQGEFIFRPGTAIRYFATELAPIVERFCSGVSRRTGLHVPVMTGSITPCVTIELAADAEVAALPLPMGIS